MNHILSKKILRLLLTMAAVGLVLMVQFGLVRLPRVENENRGSAQPAQAAGSYTLFLPIILRNYPLNTIFGVGLDQVSAAGGLEQMYQAGAQWVRSNTPVSWAAVEPTEGARNWGALATVEQELQNATSKGMQTILVVRVTPDWAQQVPGYSCGPIKQEKLSAFANFMRDLVVRYSASPYKVKYWEIWNEPDVAWQIVPPGSDWGCWGDLNDPYYNGSYYATMLQAVYPAIKSADSQAQVLVGGLLLDCDPAICATLVPPHDDKPPRFLEGILRNSGGAYFDGVSFHAYDYYGGNLGRYSNGNWASAWNSTGPVIIAKTGFINQVLGTYGASGKFLMNTELALLCDSCNSNPTFETTKAYYVAQAYAVAIAQGLRSNQWYTALGWRNSGLLYPDLSPRPAYTAYQFSRNELRDAAFVREITEYAGVKGYEFNRRDRRIWLLWSLDGSAHLVALPGTPLAAWDSLGNSVAPAGSMTIDLNPLYLEWNP